MDQDKRVLIAFVLSFGLLVLWRVLWVKEPPPAPKVPAPAPAKVAFSAQPSTATPPAPVSLPVLQGSKVEEIVVEGELYRVTFSTEGAVIKSWVLKKYRDKKDRPLDVVNRAACDALGFPLTLTLPDQALAGRLNKAVYVVKPARGLLTAPVNLEFTHSDGKIQAQKRFWFGPGYEVRAEVSVFDGQRYLPTEVAWPGGFGDHSLPSKLEDALRQAVYGGPNNLEIVPQGKVKEDRLIPGPLALAGLEDRYFVNIFLVDSPDLAFRIGRRVWTPPDWQGKDEDKPKPLVALLGSPQPKPFAFRLFVAPKDLDVLRSVKPPLDRLVDFGWFSFVAKPLFLALRYLYERGVHNYGWAIVILTIFINLAMFPLKLKSVKSAREMQRIAPLVKSIQDRYKQYKFNDPRKQRMNQEIMKLYKEHNINPLGGCLPMVLQLPFLYGFYKVLDLSIEMRHAPWFGWIRDLSAPDPIYILPTLMIVTMFMLLVFGIMFYSFACGLVLYWLTGNVVGIAQQAFMNRMMPLPGPAPVPHKAVSVKE
jgi:YidC/Oxa1 family membrane protein insertase